jgi:hypothetical protein
MKKLLCTLLLAAASLTPAQAQTEQAVEILTSPETFAICKAADMASTAYLLSHGLAIEANPLVAWSLSVGGYIPLIAVSAGIYYALKHLDNPVATGAANAVTCTVAAHNLLLIP